MNKRLLIIFLVLLGIYGISKLSSTKKTRSFQAELVRIDTTKMTQIVINAPKEAEFTLSRQDDGSWWVSNGKVSAPALRSVLTPMLASLSYIKARRVAAKHPSRWADFQVDSTQGTRIRVYQGDRLLEDLTVGKFNFDPQLQSASAYMRLTNQDEVYEVDGFVAMNLAQDFNSFRKKTLTRIARAQIRSIASQGPLSWLLERDSSAWKLNGEPADSAQVARYLATISSVSGHTFVDDFDPNTAGAPVHVLRIEQTEDTLSPVVVQCWYDTTRTQPFILHSSQNEHAFFASDSSGLFQRLFLPPWIVEAGETVPTQK